MPHSAVNSGRLQDLRVSLTLVDQSCKENDVAQEETVKSPEMPDVPRPAVYLWGIILMVVGFVFAVAGTMSYGASLALIVGSGLMALGMPMFLLGLLIHALRVEGTAIRAGVVLPYEKRT